jgi:membrane associated rhomboid family serine protease
MTDSPNHQPPAPLPPTISPEVADCLQRTQQILLNAGYSYLSGDAADWPDCAVTMTRETGTIMICPYDARRTEQLAGQWKSVQRLGDRLTGIILVGAMPKNSPEIHHLFGLLGGNTAYIDAAGDGIGQRKSTTLFASRPRALARSRLQQFLSGPVEPQAASIDCRRRLADDLRELDETEEFLDNVSQATGVTTPVLTYVLIGCFVLIYVLMSLFSGQWGKFSSETLLAWGAIRGKEVAGGEIWRFITSGFVHASLTHLIFNVLGCYYFGMTVEHYQGRWRLILIFLFSVLAGNVLGLWWHPETMSVGASGGLFGLIGCIIAMTIRYYRTFPATIRKVLKTWILTILAYNLIFAFLPGLDLAAHLGGLVGGLLLGLALSRAPLSKTRLRRAAIAAAVAVVLLTGAAGAWVIDNLPETIPPHTH